MNSKCDKLIINIKVTDALERIAAEEAIKFDGNIDGSNLFYEARLDMTNKIEKDVESKANSLRK